MRRQAFRRIRAVLACLACALLLASGARPHAGARDSDVHLSRHYTPHDRVAGRYQYVPFDVGPDTARLTVSYRYDGADGATVIDLGLLEPGPLELGRATLRGWSGGSRKEASVTREWATPGYWPGELPAGRWHVALGLYKVAEDGVDVEIDVGTATEAGDRPLEAIASTARTPGRWSPSPESAERWYRGDLHLHTAHSDGVLPAASLVKSAREAGLEFIAITDHNNTVHQIEALPPIELLVLRGEEITTPGGHANVWGLPPRAWIDFRVQPGDAAIDELAAEAERLGALFSINHPDATCDACGWTHRVPRVLNAIEIWNGPRGLQPKGIALWDELLRAGGRVTAVGSSDWHRPPAPLGSASVRVRATGLSERSILEAIRLGRVIVTGDARMRTPRFRARAGSHAAEVGDTLHVARGGSVTIEMSGAGGPSERLDVLWNGTVVDSKSTDVDRLLRFERTIAGGGYLRGVIRSADGETVALTNPIWVVAR